MIENENAVADKAYQEVGHHFGRDVQGQELTTGFDATGKPCRLVMMNSPGKGG